MRGKGFAAGVLMPACGITPAYAGKSVPVDPRRPLSGDHPRLCGEKYSFSKSWNATIGSPPPMRGKDHGKGLYLHVDGITPAYAGKSVEIRSSSPALRDHPRLCGEKNPVPDS